MYLCFLKKSQIILNIKVNNPERLSRTQSWTPRSLKFSSTEQTHWTMMGVWEVRRRKKSVENSLNLAKPVLFQLPPEMVAGGCVLSLGLSSCCSSPICAVISFYTPLWAKDRLSLSSVHTLTFSHYADHTTSLRWGPAHFSQCRYVRFHYLWSYKLMFFTSILDTLLCYVRE